MLFHRSGFLDSRKPIGFQFFSWSKGVALTLLDHPERELRAYEYAATP